MRVHPRIDQEIYVFDARFEIETPVSVRDAARTEQEPGVRAPATHLAGRLIPRAVRLAVNRRRRLWFSDTRRVTINQTPLIGIFFFAPRTIT